MKRILTAMLVLTLCSIFVAESQVITRSAYQFLKNFPNNTYIGSSGAHSIAVDPAGKVWIGIYGTSDSIVNAVTGKYDKIRVISVFNPDGTPASFSPIKTVTVAGKTDTLYNSNRGMRADANGNIVFASFDTYYRINYKTGVGMNKVVPTVGRTLTAPGFDAANEMFTAFVIDGSGPIRIYDPTFNLLGNVVDTSRGFSRTIEVSADGKDVFFAGYTNNAVTKYHSDNASLGPYSKVDTVMKGYSVESMSRHPKTGAIWASGGSAGATGVSYRYYKHYAFTAPSYTTPVDSFAWFGPTTTDPRPRGIAFSPTGDTVYVIQFNDSNMPCVQMFTKVLVSVEREKEIIPADFTLSQNFPNPFNPSTQIKFTLGNNGYTTLKVYDVVGREIAVLVDETLKAGSYLATFDATPLPSGTYIYMLTSGGHRLAHKMLLLK